MRKRLRLILLGSASWLLAGVGSFLVAWIYDTAMYEAEPDPLHFDTAAVWLGGSLILGIAATAFLITHEWSRARRIATDIEKQA